MEIELKYFIQGPFEQREALREMLCSLDCLGPFTLGRKCSEFISDVYYDRENLELRNAGFRLRLRDTGAPYVTLKRKVKTVGNRKERDEWEGPLTEAFLGEQLQRLSANCMMVPGWEAPEVDRFRAGQPCHGLLPVLRVQNARISRQIGDAAGRVIAILCLDRVTYPELNDSVFHDVEVEQLEGTDAELDTISESLILVGKGAIQPNQESKFGRGLMLRDK